jgi:SAM-dependent methyltransferase
MATLYGTVKREYHRVVPKWLRGWIWSSKSPLAPLARRAVDRLSRGGLHDEIYDARYFSEVTDVVMQDSAATMAQSIVRDFHPTSVIDVGCGSGNLMLALQEHGVSVTGYEYASAAVERCRQRNLVVSKFDIEAGQPLGRSADVAVSTEVAEHLPASVAGRFVQLLCEAAPVVVMTAAPPGQGGTDHVNEQPPEYWIEKFAARNFEFCSAVVETWRGEWRNCNVTEFYASNLLVFKKRS